MQHTAGLQYTGLVFEPKGMARVMSRYVKKSLPDTGVFETLCSTRVESSVTAHITDTGRVKQSTLNEDRLLEMTNTVKVSCGKSKQIMKDTEAGWVFVQILCLIKTPLAFSN